MWMSSPFWILSTILCVSCEKELHGEPVATQWAARPQFDDIVDHFLANFYAVYSMHVHAPFQTITTSIGHKWLLCSLCIWILRALFPDLAIKGCEALTVLASLAVPSWQFWCTQPAEKLTRNHQTNVRWNCRNCKNGSRCHPGPAHLSSSVLHQPLTLRSLAALPGSQLTRGWP